MLTAMTLAGAPWSTAPDAQDLLATLCVDIDARAAASPEEVVHTIVVAVPDDEPGRATPPIFSVQQGSVIRVHVRASHIGVVAVQQLLGPQAVKAGRSVDATFRAVDAGRFTLFFHGADGEHIEIATLAIARS